MAPGRSFFRYSIQVLLLVLLVDLVMRHWLFDDRQQKSLFQPIEYAPYYTPLTYGTMRANTSFKMSADDSTGMEMKTNRFGMRMEDVSLAKDPATTRIAVLGDHVALGWGVNREHTFPSQLESLLREKTNQRFEVLNFAAPAYTSFHVLKQYEHLVHHFHADYLIVAVGLFDSFEYRLSEPERYALLEQYGLTKQRRGILAFLDHYSFLSHWLMRPDIAQAQHEINTLVENRKKANQWLPAVSSDEIATYLGAVVEHHRRQGGQAVLVYSNVMNFRHAQAMEQFAAQQEIPYFNIRQEFDRYGGRWARQLGNRLGLKPSGFDYFDSSPPFKYVIRVYVPRQKRLADRMRVLLGTEKMSMFDDGTHGDEFANDDVWTVTVTQSTPKTIRFAFLNEPPGKRMTGTGYENTFQNRLFYHQVVPHSSETGFSWYSPVYECERIPFVSLLLSNQDPYPNRTGHQIIARHLARIVRELESGSK